MGSNLFANHCDDVVEWFEPRRESVAQFPLASGTFTYPEPSACTGGSTVITLTDASVALPSGALPLGPIEIVNEALGCFAG